VAVALPAEKANRRTAKARRRRDHVADAVSTQAHAAAAAARRAGVDRDPEEPESVDRGNAHRGTVAVMTSNHRAHFAHHAQFSVDPSEFEV